MVHACTRLLLWLLALGTKLHSQYSGKLAEHLWIWDCFAALIFLDDLRLFIDALHITSSGAWLALRKGVLLHLSANHASPSYLRQVCLGHLFCQSCILNGLLELAWNTVICT